MFTPVVEMVVGLGFEPRKAWLADLQSEFISIGNERELREAWRKKVGGRNATANKERSDAMSVKRERIVKGGEYLLQSLRIA